MIDVRRAAQRYQTVSPGITTWHCFASGAHYDPDNVAFGPVIACDEHLLAPGAGFDAHRHARVELVSWVLDGALQHADGSGRVEIVRLGAVQYQRAGTGIEHAERNASGDRPVRFVQLWLLDDADVSDYRLAEPPLALDRGVCTVLRECRDEQVAAAPFAHLYVASGAFAVAGVTLRAGDSARVVSEDVPVTGTGQLLVVRVDS